MFSFCQKILVRMSSHETPACIINVYFPLLFRLTNYWKRFWTMLLRFCLSWCVLYARLGLHIIFCWFGETSFIIFFLLLTWSSENASGQVEISYSFSSNWLRDWCELSDWLRDWCELSDWLRDWCELSWPERSKASPEQAWITFDILLKIFLNLLQYAYSPYGSLYIS